MSTFLETVCITVSFSKRRTKEEAHQSGEEEELGFFHVVLELLLRHPSRMLGREGI